MAVLPVPEVRLMYRFGAYRLDPARETLTGPDGPVVLRGHAFLVLRLLVERAPEVVSRDEILAAVWGHDALSESSIAQAIRDIRTALDDSAREPGYLVTKYGRGYQFIASVERVDPEAGAAADRSARIPRFAALLGGLFILLAIVWLGRELVSPDPPGDGPEWRLRTASAVGGEDLSGPFARYLAFVLKTLPGGERVEMAGGDDPDDARYLEIGLGVDDARAAGRFEVVVDGGGDNEAMRGVYAEADALVDASLETMLAAIEVSPEVEIESGLVSRSAHATETLLRGMSAQFSGELDRAVALFEACLAEDPGFDFARYELAIALRRTGDYSRALAELKAIAARRDTPFWRMRLYNAMGIAQWRLGRFDAALESYRISRRATDSPVLKAILGTNMGLLLRDLDRLGEAEQFLVEAVELAGEADNDRVLATALNSLASIHMRTGRLEAALPPLERARELFYAGELRSEYAGVLSRTARVHERLGDLDTAEQLLRLSGTVREQLGVDLELAATSYRLSGLARLRGHFAEARERARHGVRLSQETGDRNMIQHGQAALAALALAERRFDDARAYGGEVLRLAEARGEAGDIRDARLGLLSIRVEAGDTDSDLVEALTELRDAAAEAEHTSVNLEATLLRGRAHMRGDRPEAARDDFRSVHDAAERNGERALRVRALTWLAELELESDSVAALEHLDTAARLDPLPYPYLVLRARALAGQGQHEAALATAHEARERAGDWWNERDQALLDALVRSQAAGARVDTGDATTI